MPRKFAKKSAPRRRVKKPAARRPRIPRRIRNTPEYASLSETRTLSVQGGFLTNNLYALMNTSLEQFTRAPLVAQAYQHFRIKYIQLKIKPSFDTYQGGIGAPTPTSKPNVYYMIDKAGAIPNNITLEGLKMMGAKPRALDEKPVVIGWRPSVLEQVLTDGGAAPASQGSRYRISPWLSTTASSVNNVWTPSTVDHLGLYWYVETLVTVSQPYLVECEVQFEFKKPLIAHATGQVSAVNPTFAVLNASKDGIVDDRAGGDDTLLVH